MAKWSKKKSSRSSQSFSRDSIWSWPVRKARALWRHWMPTKSLFKVLNRSATLIKRIMHFEGKDYSVRKTGGEVFTRTWPSQKTMMNPLWWIAWTGQFVWRWFLTRPYLPMLLALPAAGALLAFVGAATTGSQVSESSQSLTYKRMLVTAMEAEQYDVAMLCSDALLQITPDSAEHLYNRALIASASGEQEAAREIMSELATERNSAKAAMWMANAVGDIQQFSAWAMPQKQEYVQWLTVASDNDPQDTAARRLKGTILSAMGDAQNAYATLLPIENTDSEVAYMLTMLERQLGLTENIKPRIEKLLRAFKEKLAANPQDVNVRIKYATLMALNEQEEEAVELLSAGRFLMSDPAQLKQLTSALVEAMVLQSKKIQENDRSPLGLMKSLNLLREAMNVDSTNAQLLEAVTQACVEAAKSENNDLFVLREAIVQGMGSDTAHFILGTIALNQGKVEEAKNHLEIAAQSNPNLPGLLNNLAFAMTQEDMPDLERALRLSEAAVRTMPTHPYLRETRGQILLRLERYTEAIADLEFALAATELRPTIRPSLSKAYAAIGQTETAQRQLELQKQGK